MLEVLLKKIDSAGRFLVGLMLGVSVLLVFTDAVLRTTVGYSIFWIQEIILYLVIWSTFMGAALAVRKGEHIQVTFILERLPKRAQRFLNIGTALIGLIFSIAFIISGVQLVIDAYSNGLASTSTLEVPLWIPYLIMPISGIIFVFGFVERIISLFREEGGN